jgi:hypothetical protein
MTVNLLPVKSAEVRALMADLKHFAFEQNPGLADGSQTGVEIRKNFFHRDNVPDSLFMKGGVESVMTSFWFSAFRLGEGKGTYGYDLHSSIARSLPTFPERLLPVMPRKMLRKHNDFKHVIRNALHESLSTEIGISDDVREELDYSEIYTLRYLGKKIYRARSDTLKFADGDFVEVPPLESDYADQSVIWVQKPVEEDRMEDPVDAIELYTQFWDTVAPLNDTIDRDGFRIAAGAARRIIESLRTGSIE